MNTGLVFRVTGTTAILLVDGCFREVPVKKGWKKGDVVTLAKVRRGARAARFARHTATVAAGVVLMLVLSIYTAYYYLGDQVTYVSVDVNPSIELALNRFDWVVSSTSYNVEGASTLEKLKLRWLPVEDALRAVISSPEMAQHLEDGTVMVAMSSSEEKSNTNSKLAGAMRALKDDLGQANFIYSNADWSMREDAEKSGVSVGKMALAQQIQTHDPEAETDELLQHSTGELIEMLKELQKDA